MLLDSNGLKQINFPSPLSFLHFNGERIRVRGGVPGAKPCDVCSGIGI